MSSEASPTQNDPLFGNAASDLLREAASTEGKPPSDPRFWQPPTPEELQSRLTGYVIEAFLARGGMGAVYRGMQTSLERAVAIKILPSLLSEHDASFAQRFKQEARAMAQLNHPGIVKVFDFGEMSDGTLYFIMEFIDGTDVGQMVARQGRLSSAHAMAITAHVCDALQYAHELGIVHRDIKPANIMVGIDGQVKVADFGLAKSFSSGQTSLTMTGHVMGTVHFVAPEALTLGSSVDHRADIYAVGVMLYQMLTGRLPQGIFEMPSMLVKGLDPRYDAIIAAAMREDRNARYQAIYEMRHALDAIITQPVPKTQTAPQERPAVAHSQTAPQRPQFGRQDGSPQSTKQVHGAPKKSSRGMWAALTAIAVVLSGVGFIIWGGKTKEPPAPIASAEFKMQPSLAASPKTPTAADLIPPNPPSAIPPSPPSAISSTLSQTVDVKLEFKNAEKYYDVGGYYPSELPLSSKVPMSVSKAPANLVSPLYGVLKLGPPGSQRSHAIITSYPKTESTKLYVDGNANGDLTDDPPAQWQPRQQTHRTTGVKYDVSHGYLTVEINCADGTHQARFEVFEDDRNGNIAGDCLLIHPLYGRVGSVNLNGKSYKALLYDDGSKGDFSAPSSTFRLDLAGGSGFRWEEAEAFPVTEFFTVEGMTYQLSGLTPSGDAFKIVPTPSWIGQTAPALSATTITGDKISLPGSYKGKIVLVHFWSIGQKLGLDDLPQLKAAYEKHHSANFDMLAICVEYRHGKEKLPAFVKDNNILWPQVCEHQSGAMDHPVLKLFKTHSVPSSFLIDGDTGGILACGVRGGALEAAIAKALSEKKQTPSQVIPTKNSPLNHSDSPFR